MKRAKASIMPMSSEARLGMARATAKTVPMSSVASHWHSPCYSKPRAARAR